MGRALSAGRHQPGLAPAPVSAQLDADPPLVTITVLPGSPIAGRWSENQIRLMAEAMRRLWSVPCDGMTAIDWRDPAYWRNLVAGSQRPVIGVEAVAYDLAVGWIDGPELESLLDGCQPQILGQGDPQPGNMLYDGISIRLVDFEDAGPSDVCWELANFVEHLGTRDTGLDRLADLVDHDDQRYRRCRALIASFWLFALLPDPTGSRPPRSAELHRQALRLSGLFDEPL